MKTQRFPFLLFLLCWILTACQSSPSQAQIFSPTPSSSTKRIALWLPMQGAFGPSGQAVIKGFLAAYHQNLSSYPAPIEVYFFDTEKNSIKSLYNQAERQQMNLIIGPLLKPQVTELQKLSPSIPVLALNRLSPQETQDNFVELSLSPLPEAQLVAQRALSEGHRHFLLLAPNTLWGQEIAQSFQESWEKGGGDILETLTFASHQNPADSIKRLLRFDQSEARIQALNTVLREKPRAIPRRRQDIDGVFLVADTQDALQIRPLFAYYYADSLPIYSVSAFFSLNHKSTDLKDLRGIHFPEMPWLLSRDFLTPSLESLKETLSHENDFLKNSTLYALGVDAYTISQYLLTHPGFPESGLPGATGLLHWNRTHTLDRQPVWVIVTDAGLQAA